MRWGDNVGWVNAAVRHLGVLDGRSGTARQLAQQRRSQRSAHGLFKIE